MSATPTPPIITNEIIDELAGLITRNSRKQAGLEKAFDITKRKMEGGRNNNVIAP